MLSSLLSSLLSLGRMFEADFEDGSLELLALGRLYATLVGSDPVSTYTWGALVFEVVLASLATVALKQNAPTTST